MSVKISYDCFGRELETHQCEYCGQVKPVKLWNGIKNCRDTYNNLMVEYLGHDERKMWRCTECTAEMANKA